MERVLPPEVDKVINWCLAKKEFQDANFLYDVKSIMKNNQKLSRDQAIRLTNILQKYTLNRDLEEMIREREGWR